MSLDRRQFQRFETLLIVEISPCEEGKSYFLGITKDVSHEGFIFESQNHDLQVGDIFEFNLKHPKNNSSVPVLGEIIWNREMKFEFHSGVKFHRLADETKSKVYELISADSEELSGHAITEEEFMIETKQQRRTEADKKCSEDVLSDIIGRAATHNGNDQVCDKGDDEAPIPTNIRQQREDMSEPLSDAAGIHDQGAESREVNQKPEQENSLIPPAGSIAVRRKAKKRKSIYTYVSIVFIILIIATAVVPFMPGNIREKIFTPEAISKFIDDPDSLQKQSIMLSPSETDTPETSPAYGDQLEFLKGDDLKIEEGYGLTGDSVPSGQRGVEEQSGSETGQKQLLPVTGGIVPAQNKEVPGSKTEKGTDLPVASLQDRPAGKAGRSNPVHGSTDEDVASDRIAALVKEIREEQKNGVPVKEEPERALKTKTAKRKDEKTSKPEKEKRLKNSTKQKEVKAGLNNSEDGKKTLLTAQKKEQGVVKNTAVKQHSPVVESTQKDIKHAAAPEEENVKYDQIARNAAGDPGGRSNRDIRSVKEPVPDLKREEIIKKVKPTKQRSVRKKEVKKDSLPIEVTATAAENQILATVEPHAGSGSTVVDVEGAAIQEQSTKTAGMERMPRISLVLENQDPDVLEAEKSEPDLTDAYLKEYFTSYSDSFDGNSNNWDIFDIGAASASIENGYYHIENKKQGGALIVLHYQRFPHENDFVIEIGIRAIETPDGNSYGFIFGAKDARDNFSFQIRDRKFYSVKNYHHGVPEQLFTGELKDSLINENSVTLLKVVKRAHEIYFAINGGYVGKVSNIEFYGNQIGFIVEGRSHIAIDYTRSYVRNADRGQTR